MFLLWRHLHQGQIERPRTYSHADFHTNLIRQLPGIPVNERRPMRRHARPLVPREAPPAALLHLPRHQQQKRKRVYGWETDMRRISVSQSAQYAWSICTPTPETALPSTTLNTFRSPYTPSVFLLWSNWLITFYYVLMLVLFLGFGPAIVRFRDLVTLWLFLVNIFMPQPLQFGLFMFTNMCLLQKHRVAIHKMLRVWVIFGFLNVAVFPIFRQF